MPSVGCKTYTTSDLTQAAFMMANGIQLLGSRREHTRTFFLFKGGQGTEEVISQYFGNGPVAIGDFRRAWHDLKNVIFSPHESAEDRDDSSED